MLNTALHLNYKNIKSIIDLQATLNELKIKSGYKAKDGKIYQENEIVDEVWTNNYVLQTPNEVLKSKVGVCWDFVEIYREWAKENKIDYKTFFIEYNPTLIPNAWDYATHTILIYKSNNKLFWFDNAYQFPSKLNEYDNMEELIDDFVGKHAYSSSKALNEVEKYYLDVYQYDEPPFGLYPIEYVNFCRNGRLIRSALNSK